ncbi:MAG: T9SS type A sorting domain-containing protein [Bacteroidota bacterium]
MKKSTLFLWIVFTLITLKVASQDAAPILLGLPTPALCHGNSNGSIDLTVITGAPPYTYLWSAGATTEDISGLAAGWYSVTVTESTSLASTGSWEVTQPAVLEIVHATPRNPSCNGADNGAILITVTGGTPGYTYTYEWSNGQTSQNLPCCLFAGCYTVTITDLHGCQASGNWCLIEPEAPLTVAGSVASLICNGAGNGSVDLTVSGGTFPYEYTWSNGQSTQDVSGLAAGNYSVTVRDVLGCPNTTEWTVNQPEAIILNITESPPLCHGDANGSLDLTVSGGTPGYLYLWNTGETTQDIAGLASGWYSVTVTDANTCQINSSWEVTEPDILTLNGNASPVLCRGSSNGSISVTVSGGTSPYQYSWNNGATVKDIAGLTVGWFTVTITDAHACQTSGSWEITQPDALSLSGTAYPVLCNGNNTGSIGIAISGGISPYKYLWSNGATVENVTGLLAGWYVVTITDANTCQISNSWEVIQPNAFSLAGEPTPVVCNGGNNGSIAVSVSGATSPYKYLWSNGATLKEITGLSAGWFTVTITDANMCQTDGSWKVIQPDPTAINGTLSNVLCYGGNTGSILITVSGGTSPFQYLWSNGATGNNITGLTAGWFTVTITDANNCQASNNWELTQPEALSLNGTVVPVLCNGGNTGSVTITVSGGTSPFRYLWSSGATVKDITGLTAGWYSVTVSDGNSCQIGGNWNVTQPDPIFVDAGDDQQLCQQNITVLSGNWPPTGSSGNWTLISRPPGTPLVTPFPVNSPIATVVGLLPNETVPYIFKYTITKSFPDGSTCTVSDNMQVFNKHYPSPPYAGPDKNLCMNVLPLHDTMTASASLYGTGVWSQVPGGPIATIANTLDPHTGVTYNAAGRYAFLWTVNNGSCVPNEPNQDSVIIKIYTPAAVYAGADVITCSASPITISDSWKSDSCMTVLWSTNGTGVFNSQTILHPIYTPSAGDVAAGGVTLTLHGVIGCCSPCGPATAVDSMIITFHHSPIATVSFVNASCNGSDDGSLTVAVSSGVPPFLYLWSNGQTTATATGLIAGSYTVTVTGNDGCEGTASGTVHEPAVLSLSGVSTDVKCFDGSDGSVNLTVSGGTSPYSFIWSNGSTTEDIIGLKKGAYTVTITDLHSCSGTGSWFINEPPEWNIGILGDTTACCINGVPGALYTYTATVSGAYAPPVTYQWVVEGGTIESGQNSLSITVRWNCCGSGKVWLTVHQGTIPCSLTTFIQVIINPAPAPVISGPVSVISDSGNVQYCTPYIANHLYTWTVIGGTIASGWGTNCITVNWGPYPACGCGEVTVCESTQLIAGGPGCTACTTMNINILPNGSTINLQGFVMYDNPPTNTPLNGVVVTLKNSMGNILGSVATANNQATGQPGYYSFTNLPDGVYNLSATSTDAWGGNNATDALIIQLNIIGIYPLYFLRNTVADVNQSMSITALDALYVKLRTVNMITSYPAGDWKFRDSTFTLTGSAVVNLIGLCVGDVNGSNIPDGLKGTSYVNAINDGVRLIQVNESFNYSISAGQLADLGAMTLLLGFNPKKYKIEEVVSSLEGLEYGIKDGTIALAWSDIKPISVDEGDPIFVLRMKARAPVFQPEQIFKIQSESEFADRNARKYDNYTLKMSDVTTESPSAIFSLTNYPNPFSETTEIDYTIPVAGHVRLTLTDMVGITLKTLVNANQAKGSYTITIDPREINLKAGLYLYKFEVEGSSESYKKTNRMIFTR